MVEGTVTTKPEDLLKNGTVPRITCSAMNNGLEDTYQNPPTEHGHVLTVDSAAVGFVAYQEYDFIATDHVEKLTLRNHQLSKYLGLFFVTTISSAINKKYNYGYKFSQERIRRQIIVLPVTNDTQPDYVFMESFIRQREQRMIHDYIEYVRSKLCDAHHDVLSLEGVRWGKFAIGDLFTLVTGKGKGANHLEHDKEGISYLGATNRNNAVLDFVKRDDKLIQKGNCIAFIRNGEGSIGYSVYKSEDFIATSDITAGYSPYLNRHNGMFITTVADKVRGKYNFNYKRSDTRLKKEMIQLPIDDEGNPDWEFMTQYMQAHEYELLLRYLTRRA